MRHLVNALFAFAPIENTIGGTVRSHKSYSPASLGSVSDIGASKEDFGLERRPLHSGRRNGWCSSGLATDARIESSALSRYFNAEPRWVLSGIDAAPTAQASVISRNIGLISMLSNSGLRKAVSENQPRHSMTLAQIKKT
jgi:hypothetical protein